MYFSITFIKEEEEQKIIVKYEYITSCLQQKSSKFTLLPHIMVFRTVVKTCQPTLDEIHHLSQH